MGNICPVASDHIKKQVIQNCWDYLYQNFGKFNDSNKIKITLAIISKDMPTKLEGDIAKGPTQIVVVKSKEDIGNPAQEVPREIPIKQ